MGTLAITLYVLFSMLAVIYFDVTRYIIPNWLVGSLLAIYPLAVWMTPGEVDWKMALAAMAVTFAVGYVVFAMRWMGGGDIKLIIVCALWVGMKHLPDFIIITALLGGIFALALWSARKLLPHLVKRETPWPRILREGEPVPYGVAIALAMLKMVWVGALSVLLVIPVVAVH